jgi:siroheme synthase
MVYVGKAAGFHTRTQEEIHALLQARARATRPRPRTKSTCGAVTLFREGAPRP